MGDSFTIAQWRPVAHPLAAPVTLGAHLSERRGSGLLGSHWEPTMMGIAHHLCVPAPSRKNEKCGLLIRSQTYY